jgi:DNA-binding transcriptional ArsR family regulator
MGTDYTPVAKLLAVPARSAVMDALMGGKPLAAGELAQVAGVRASTISEHLSALVDGGLLTVVEAGRHRYYTLSDPAVAEALEALSHICPATPVRSLRQSSAQRSLRLARLCYDHVAGAVGVALLDSMRAADWLSADLTDNGAEFAVTDLGAKQLDRLGLDVAACRRARRHFARPCLDWTERRMHLAGSLGAAMRDTLERRDWLRHPKNGRGLRVTPEGRTGLNDTFGIDLDTLED